MRSTVLALLSVIAFAPACGSMDGESADDIEVTHLGGLDLPADSAGGHFVRNQGALAVGGSKSATLSGRDLYHGYTVTARRGDTIYLRGIATMYMAIVAVYGPQAADGSWGPQLTKKWSYRPLERKIPTVSYAVTKAGKYLAVFGIPQRDVGAPQDYVLSACNGDCVAGGCVEWTSKDSSNYSAINVLNHAEGALLSHANGVANAVVRTGSCASQSRACGREQTPVCGQVATISHNQGITYDNICLAQVAQRTSMGDKLTPQNLWTASGACAAQ